MKRIDLLKDDQPALEAQYYRMKDEVRKKQPFMNLVSNALTKFSADGKGKSLLKHS
jgi:hypothetical protein